METVDDEDENGSQAVGVSSAEKLLLAGAGGGVFFGCNEPVLIGLEASEGDAVGAPENQGPPSQLSVSPPVDETVGEDEVKGIPTPVGDKVGDAVGTSVKEERGSFHFRRASTSVGLPVGTLVGTLVRPAKEPERREVDSVAAIEGTTNTSR